MGNIIGAISVVFGLLIAPSVIVAPVSKPTQKEVLIVGDSVMAILLYNDAALTLLNRTHPFLLRTVTCQRLVLVGCKPYAKESSLKILKINKGKFSRVIVVGTGYNDRDDTNFPKAVHQITCEAQAQGVEVLWLTYRQAGNVRMKSLSFNRQLFRLAEKIDNLHIVDWNELSTGRSEWFTADSLHLNASGGFELAKIISAAIDDVVSSEGLKRLGREGC